MIGDTAILPPGPYIFEVVELQQIKRTIAGNDAACFVMQLLGYEFNTFWWLSRSLPHEWRDIAPQWSREGLRSIEGTAYLFNVKVERYNNRPRNLLGMPLAKVVSEPF